MTNAPPLSARETTILRWADEHARGRLTAQDIRALLGDAAPRVASSMARKGLLDRVGRGVYLVRPLRAVADPWTHSALAGVAHLLAGEPYYVGGPAALTLHRLTSQLFTSRLDVYVRRQRRPRTIGNARVTFHITADWAFTFGLTTVQIEGVDVHVTDPERTLLDILERTERLVGLRLADRAVREALPRVNLERLVAYALRWPTASTRQRLGLLLERRGVSPELLAPLAAAAAVSRSLPSIRPGRPRVGGVHPVWRIVENDRPARERTED